jgi:8-oxo-dGTP diphosphatase
LVQTIYKVGAIILNERKQLLVVRKRVEDRTEFIIPGGRQEPGEADLHTLARELQEELGVSLESSTFFGKFEDIAVFENVPLVMSVYQTIINGKPTPQSEIKEYAWIDRDYSAKGYCLGSVLSKYVIPTLIATGQM